MVRKRGAVSIFMPISFRGKEMNYSQKLLLVLASLIAVPAAAQSIDSSTGRMEEITTSARKTEEIVQDVPIAISAFTAKEMARRNIQELEDVALYTPGLAFEDYGGGYGNPVIRGGAQLRIQDLDTTTSVYLDGVYLSRQYMIDFGTVGFDRIEVVKGPQSALFGRNAFFGAVNYVSGGPGDELDVQIQATAGSDDRYDVTAAVGGPIIADKLGARVIAAYSEFDGTFKNDFPGDGRDYGKRGTTDNLSGWENSTIGLNLELTPTDALAFELDYYHVERFQEANPATRQESRSLDMNCSFDPDYNFAIFDGTTQNGGNRFFCGELPSKFTPTAGAPGSSPPGTEFVNDPRGFALDVETDFLQAHARFEFSESWAGVYQFGYSDSEVAAAGAGNKDPIRGDVTFVGPSSFINGTPIGTNEYQSHELRVEFNSGQWSALGGLFTSKIEDRDIFDFGFAPLATSTLEPFSVSPSEGFTDTSEFGFALPLVDSLTDVTTNAVFARVGYETADERWRFGVEARFQDEEKELTLADGRMFKESFETFTPRFTADYRLNDDQMVYASLAKGAKSGGFNTFTVGDFIEEQRSYDPDENWTVEFGSKNDLLDGRLRLNAAIYYTDWSDLQVNTNPIPTAGNPDPDFTAAIIGNTKGADIWGIELDGVWFATDMLSVDYALSYTSAEYKSGAISARIAAFGSCDDIVCPSDGSIGGNKLQRQPAFQSTLGGALQGTMAGDWDWYARADVNYQSKTYVDEFNLTYVPDRTIVNARLELKNGPWTGALWAKNLFDEQYLANSFFTAVAGGTSYGGILGNLRTFGLTLTYDLGASRQ
jgi:iron complex outermembrane receptor protein